MGSSADALQWERLPFPSSLSDFQRLFPDDDACAHYLEAARWAKGFVCPHCGEKGEPFRMATRTSVLTCRKCRKQTSLTVGTVMAGSHSPLTTWFCGAYLVLTATPGISALQFQRLLGLSRYETAFQILHKLRAGMAPPDGERIGVGQSRGDHVEIGDLFIGGSASGAGREILVVAAVEVRALPPQREDGSTPRAGRAAGRLRLGIAANRGSKALCGFAGQAVEPGATVVTDAWRGYAPLAGMGYQHLPAAQGDDTEVAEECLPVIRSVYRDLRDWFAGTHHGAVSPKHMQAYLNEFVFRFNRSFSPATAFRSLLGIGTPGATSRGVREPLLHR